MNVPQRQKQGSAIKSKPSTILTRTATMITRTLSVIASTASVIASKAKQSSGFNYDLKSKSVQLFSETCSNKIPTILFSILFCLMSFALKAAILVDLSPHNIKLGQTFKLILTQEGSSQFDMPDLQSLQADFTVMGTERSASYSLINGQTSSSVRWVILLQPKKAGTVIIPSIRLGNEKTTASTIEVQASNYKPMGTKKESAEGDIFLTATVDKKTPFVNEEVNYTVKLYKNQNLLDASYQPPQIENALLIPLGNNLRYQDLKNGQMYTVEEQRYAIFPQKSGEIKVLGPTLEALLYSSMMPEQIKVRAPNIKLQVQPALLPQEKPKDKSLEWTPAKKLVLHDYYDKNETSFSEGSTLQRRIVVEGVGLPAQLLPNIVIAKNKNFSVYQEKAVEKNALKNNELVGKRTLKLTYLLNKAGTVQIPEQKLSWFNTQTKQEETAILPSRTLEIRENTKAEAALSSPSIQAPTQISSRVTADQVVSAMPPTETFWWWIAAFFAFLWLGTLLLWWKGKTLFTGNQAKKLKLQLKQACLSNEPESARMHLIAWAKTIWEPNQILDLADIMRLSGDEALNHEISTLVKALYQAKSKSWQGASLWYALSIYKKNKVKQKNKQNPLPPSNPR